MIVNSDIKVVRIANEMEYWWSFLENAGKKKENIFQHVLKRE